MKFLGMTSLMLCMFCTASGQENSVEKLIIKAGMDYIEGFYEGDTAKLIGCLKPTLYKFGYWQHKTTLAYEPDGFMTYRQAIDFAKRVAEKQRFAKADSPKKIEVLDILSTIAAIKVTAYWGYDYILLAKQGDKWMIEQVLWQGPLAK